MTDTDCPITEAKKAIQCLYLELPESIANDVKVKVYAAFHHLAYNRYVDLADGASAVKQLFDLSLVGPDIGFKAEEVAKACAIAWKLKPTDR